MKFYNTINTMRHRFPIKVSLILVGAFHVGKTKGNDKKSGLKLNKNNRLFPVCTFVCHQCMLGGEKKKNVQMEDFCLENLSVVKF